ncbi:mitochondrial import inner membrane translocase subunit Tim21 [Petromyzon marinus]|uniref:mitochondrial import inner membrane translocase subunit Tim21 n=1 Tax=Petromyzon marinus TaxID=7757 RepID=UPI003F729D9F
MSTTTTLLLLRAASAQRCCCGGGGGGVLEPAMLASRRAASLGGAWAQLLPGTRSPCSGWGEGSRGAKSMLVRGPPLAGTRSHCTWGWWAHRGSAAQSPRLCHGRRLHVRPGPSGAAVSPRCGQVRGLSRGDGAGAKRREEGGRALAERAERGAGPATTAQRVKDAGRDLTYLGVILLGVGLTGALLYPVFIELFSSWSPNRVYTSALGRCRDHPEVMAALGLPISGYGETTRRGRRQHVSHLEFEQEGVKHMRVKFYISGSEPMAKGTVHAEVVQTPKGKFEYRYLFVELETYPRRIIIIEDNR